MTDPRLEKLVRDLGEENVPAWVESDGIEYVRVPLRLGYVEVVLTRDGWEAISLGVPKLDWRVSWSAPDESGVTMLVLLLRQLLLLYPPDQGRGVANGPPSGPERDGTEVPGGEGAGEIGDSGRRYDLLADLGFWVAIAGVFVFALLDELDALESARALTGAFVVLLAGATVAVTAVRRGRRAAR